MLGKSAALVTRERARAGTVVQQLRARGIEPFAVPCLEIVALPALTDAAVELRGSATPCWLVVTSATAVRLLAEEFTRQGFDAGAILGSKMLAAVGEKTARALALHAPEHAAILVPERSNSVALGELLVARIRGGSPARVVLCRGLDADPLLPQLLTEVELSEFAIYQGSNPTLTAHEISELHRALALPSGQLAILVTSLATGGNLLAQVRQHAPAAEAVLLSSRVIAIGPGTSEGLRALGFSKVETPAQQSIEAMIAML